MATHSIGVSAKPFGLPKADGWEETRPQPHRQRDQERQYHSLRRAVVCLRIEKSEEGSRKDQRAQRGTKASPLRSSHSRECDMFLSSRALGHRKPVELFLAHRAEILPPHRRFV